MCDNLGNRSLEAAEDESTKGRNYPLFPGGVDQSRRRMEVVPVRGLLVGVGGLEEWFLGEGLTE